MRGGVTDAGQTTNNRTLMIELLSQWKLEAEFRKNCTVLLLIEVPIMARFEIVFQNSATYQETWGFMYDTKHILVDCERGW